MTNNDKDKKIEALEKMFGTRDEFKLSGDKANTKKQNVSPEPLKEESNQEDSTENVQDFELKDDIILPTPTKKIEEEFQEKDEPEEKIKIEPSKNFPLEKLKENLKPEVKEVIKKLENVVPKESVSKLINIMENNKNILFDEKVTNVFNGLSSSEASLLGKKLAEWDVPKEASEVNASVILAWLNKTKK